MSNDISQKSTLLKKYLLKRQRKGDQDFSVPVNIFQNPLEGELDQDGDYYMTKKYQTLSTNLDNSFGMNISQTKTIVLPTISTREESRDQLPSKSFGLKLSQVDISIEKTIGGESTLIKAKQRRISRHISDPFYTRIEKTNCPRTLQKHTNYQKVWHKANERRRGKSLIDRSSQKATQNLSVIREYCDKRRKTPSFEDLLRNRIEEKTYISPSMPKPELDGLIGKGGKIIPLFQEVRILQQVLKYDKGHK